MIKKSTWLPCSQARAFALFTEEASSWWPESRRHTGDPTSAIRLVPKGRFWERAADGREVELGRVLEWSPPDRLVLDFYPGTDPLHPTQVVVTFAASGDGTCVTVEHGPTPGSDDLWSARAPKFELSWDLLLSALARSAELPS